MFVFRIAETLSARDFQWSYILAGEAKSIVAAMASGRKILVAVDDSEVSAYAFTWALHNLFRKTDQVIVLTAAPFVDITYPSSDMAAGMFTYLFAKAHCACPTGVFLSFDSWSWYEFSWDVVSGFIFYDPSIEETD